MAGSYNPNNSGQYNSLSSTGVGGNGGPNRSFFSKILRNLSSWGMNYDDMISRNRVAIGVNEDPQAVKNYGMYDFFSQRAIASLMNKKSIPYLDQSYGDKRRILREYSIKDEIKDFVTTIADESVVYDDAKNFCTPTTLSEDYAQDIKDRYQEAFDDIYQAFGFNDGKMAWEYFKTFLVDGFLTFEIIYDDKQQRIIGFEPVDAVTFVPGFEPMTGEHIWIQYPEDPLLRRVLLDSQIIYISYKTQNNYSETSYVEGLIRPYNQLKLIEQTKIMYNMVHATVYQKFTIPIQGLSRQRAEEQIAQLISDYSEEIEFDDDLGTVRINGKKHLPYNKQIWFPEGDTGTPNMELVTPEGHNLNENDMLTWFYNALKRASRIPFTRFDNDNGGGNLYSDASEMTRDEIKFSNFISRLQTTFKEIMVKPLKLQMLIEYPELLKDSTFLNNINVEFHSNDLFEEWKRLNNFKKRADIVATMLSTITVNDKPYFHIEYLINSVMKLTEKEKQENQAMWEKYPDGIVGGSGGSGGDDFGAPGNDFGGGDDFSGGGGDDFGGGDIDTGGDTGNDNEPTNTGGDDDFDF